MPSRSRRWPAPPATRWRWNRSAPRDKAAVLDALGAAAAALRARLGESLASVRAMDVPAGAGHHPVARGAQGLQPGRGQPRCRPATTTTRSRSTAAPSSSTPTSRWPTPASARCSRTATPSTPASSTSGAPTSCAIGSASTSGSTSPRTTTATSPTRCRSISRCCGCGTALYPNDFTAPNNLAVIQLQLGDYAAARDAAREALRLAPRNELPRLNLSWALLFNGELAEAATAAQAAIDANLASEFLREVPAWSAYFRGDAAELDRQLADAGPARPARRADVLALPAVVPAAAGQGQRGDRAVDGARRSRSPGRAAGGADPGAGQAGAGATRCWATRRRRGPRRARPQALVGDARPPLELGLALVDAGDVEGAERWMARLRAASPDSTFVNQLEIPQVQAALALRARHPERALDGARSRSGSLDASYTASARYLRTRALRAAGRFREAMAEAEPFLARPWLTGPAGDRPGAAPGIRPGRGRAPATSPAARRTYQDLLALWTAADRRFPAAAAGARRAGPARVVSGSRRRRPRAHVCRCTVPP